LPAAITSDAANMVQKDFFEMASDTNGAKSHSTKNGFPEAVLQLIGDDSWRSEGKRPELFEIRRRRIEFSGRPELALEASK
jgi:hypothetical protein